MKEEATVTTDAVPTTKLLFGMYDCTFDSDVGMGDFSLVWGGGLHVCRHAHVRSHVSPGMNCVTVHF